MLQSHTFKGDRPGKKLLVLGAVHGDETCGPAAINRVIAEFLGGQRKLEQGQVTFIPVCNPEAYEKGVRYVAENLNRNLIERRNPKNNEQLIANELIQHLRDCDALLDIHSYHAGGPAFAIINKATPKKYANFAASLNVGYVLSGWTDAYLASAPKNLVRTPHEHIGTTEVAFALGALDVTLECGQHRDPKAPLIAYEGILRALKYLNIANIAELSAAQQPKVATIESVIYSDGEHKLADGLKHFDIVEPGTVIVRGRNSTINTSYQALTIFPRPEAPKGDELIYLGRVQPHALTP